MAWWESEGHGKDVMLGDDGFGLLHHALQQFSKLYLEEVDRLPTSTEFLVTLEEVLRIVARDSFGDLDNREIVKVTAKYKDARKLHKFEVGDYFRIRLPSGDFYYGRILHDGTAGKLVEIYDLQTERPLSGGELLQRELKVALYKHVNGGEAFRTGRWPIIAHRDIDPDFDFPAFRLGSPTTYFGASRGDRMDLISAAEARRLEPKVMFPPDTIEEKLEQRAFGRWPEIREFDARFDRDLEFARQSGDLAPDP